MGPVGTAGRSAGRAEEIPARGEALDVDTATLRVCFAVVALTLLVLFYLAAYRTTRSPYCGWWCCSLVLFVASSALYLGDHTQHQVWANPLGNVLAVLGGGAVWAAGASLRSIRRPWWWLAAPAAVVGAASVVDDPARNDWSGGEVFLPAMMLLLALATLELWRFRADVLADPRVRRDGPLPAIVMAMVLTSGAAAVFYLGRSIAFALVGPDGDLFVVAFGSPPTTLLLIVLLATVSFSMASLSNEQRTLDLQARAARDGLTGLLNRAEFVRQAEALLVDTANAGRGAALVMADLDHFKRINDSRGHAAGDEVLQAFAACCTAATRFDDLVGRYGGEEFVLLLPGADADRAEDVTTRLSALFAEVLSGDADIPTASYGIAVAGPGDELAVVVAAADAAMYRAKQEGRDRVVRAGDRA